MIKFKKGDVVDIVDELPFSIFKNYSANYLLGKKKLKITRVVKEKITIDDITFFYQLYFENREIYLNEHFIKRNNSSNKLYKHILKIN